MPRSRKIRSKGLSALLASVSILGSFAGIAAALSQDRATQRAICAGALGLAALGAALALPLLAREARDPATATTAKRARLLSLGLAIMLGGAALFVAFGSA